MTHKERHSVQECNIKKDLKVDKCDWHVDIGVIVVTVDTTWKTVFYSCSYKKSVGLVKPI